VHENPKAVRLEKKLTRGHEVEMVVDGRQIKAFRGETVAAALLAAGHWVCQTHEGRPLGVFCNVGVCHGCLMTINGISGVRACQTEVAEGLRVETRRLVKERS